MSFIDTLQEYVFLRYVLKVLGIALFVLGLVIGWHELHLIVKLLLIFGGLAFFVGLRYDRIYPK